MQEALVKGDVSPRQARAAAKAEKAKPGEGRRLVAKAPSMSVTELETDANRVVAAASSESDEEKAERLRGSARCHGTECRRAWGTGTGSSRRLRMPG